MAAASEYAGTSIDIAVKSDKYLPTEHVNVTGGGIVIIADVKLNESGFLRTAISREKVTEVGPLGLRYVIPEYFMWPPPDTLIARIIDWDDIGTRRFADYFQAATQRSQFEAALAEFSQGKPDTINPSGSVLSQARQLIEAGKGLSYPLVVAVDIDGALAIEMRLSKDEQLFVDLQPDGSIKVDKYNDTTKQFVPLSDSTPSGLISEIHKYS